MGVIFPIKQITLRVCLNIFLKKYSKTGQPECFTSGKGSTLSKKIITEDSNGNVKEHESITDCAKYLQTDNVNIRGALKRKGNCKKHKIYLKGESAAKTLSDLS